MVKYLMISLRSRNKEVLNFIINARDVLNEQIKDPHFEINRLFGYLKGFKRFFTDSLRIKEDVEFFNLLFNNNFRKRNLNIWYR